eukprot:GHRQ01017812.1.p1 GENE.GHRQ01017812.1~~GHRQ01017812.1.p1  ORF type:complete len:133 (+),score=24.25 GHRQ01017812.1:473-871(+)
MRAQVYKILLEAEVGAAPGAVRLGLASAAAATCQKPHQTCQSLRPASAVAVLTHCMHAACLQEDARPEPCNENLIINELIREYLIFNGYRDTLSVFLPGAHGRYLPQLLDGQHWNLHACLSCRLQPLCRKTW